MNCRHTAALALVGWYLMVPPTKNDKIVLAPLAKWTLHSVYNSQEECESMVLTSRILLARGSAQRLAATTDPALTPQEMEQKFKILSHGQCIAADDSRLAK